MGLASSGGNEGADPLRSRVGPGDDLIAPGVRWAILSALARELTPGPLRDAARAAAAKLWPGMGKQGAALVAAVDLGHTQRSNLTPQGRAATASILPSENPVPEPLPPIRSIYRLHVDFLHRLLAKEIPSAAVREELEFFLPHVQDVVDGAPYTDANVLALVQVTGYIESGINLSGGPRP